mgnify:CR=1 FL=1
MGLEAPPDFRLLQGLLVPALAGLEAPVDPPLHQLQVGKDQLQFNGLNVPPWPHRALHVNDVVIRKAPHHMNHGVGLPDVGKELVSQTFPLAGPLDQTGDVYKLDHGRGDLFRIIHLPQLVQPLVRNRNNPYVGIDGAEGIVGGLGAAPYDRVKKGAFAHVWQADDAEFHGWIQPFCMIFQVDRIPLMP